MYSHVSGPPWWWLREGKDGEDEQVAFRPMKPTSGTAKLFYLKSLFVLFCLNKEFIGVNEWKNTSASNYHMTDWNLTPIAFSSLKNWIYLPSLTTLQTLHQQTWGPVLCVLIFSIYIPQRECRCQRKWLKQPIPFVSWLFMTPIRLRHAGMQRKRSSFILVVS